MCVTKKMRLGMQVFISVLVLNVCKNMLNLKFSAYRFFHSYMDTPAKLIYYSKLYAQERKVCGGTLLKRCTVIPPKNVLTLPIKSTLKISSKYTTSIMIYHILVNCFFNLKYHFGVAIKIWRSKCTVVCGCAFYTKAVKMIAKKYVELTPCLLSATIVVL